MDIFKSIVDMISEIHNVNDQQKKLIQFREHVISNREEKLKEISNHTVLIQAIDSMLDAVENHINESELMNMLNQACDLSQTSSNLEAEKLVKSIYEKLIS